MKQFASIFMMFIAMFAMGNRPAGGLKTQVHSKQCAMVEFTDQVKLLNVFLKGQYLFVHDDSKMARGEPCTWVYRQKSGQPDELILSFHCQPIERKPVAHFTVTVARLGDQVDVREVKEYQFAGSDEGHRVPEP